MTYRPSRMQFGIFLAPFHRTGEHPILAVERDFELVQHLDRLGFDEAWIGEHHSAGWELIADPAVFIAAAAERTRTIRLGTGVTSLPYHHPLIVADRMVQLDYQTRGRAMLGVGPGALTSDAYMMGIDPVTQRQRMDESLEAIVALLEAEAPVTMETDWFTLRDARLQMPSYTQPYLPLAVAHSFSPAGPRAAGRFGAGLLSVASAQPGGLIALRGGVGLGGGGRRRGGAHDQPRRLACCDPLPPRGVEGGGDGPGQRGRAGPTTTTTSARCWGGRRRPARTRWRRWSRAVAPSSAAPTMRSRLSSRYSSCRAASAGCSVWPTNGPRRRRRTAVTSCGRATVAPRFQGWLDPVRGSEDWVAGHRDDIFGARQDTTEQAFHDAGLEVPERIAKMQRGRT